MRKYLLILTTLVVCYSSSYGQFYFSVSPSLFSEFLNFSEDNGMTYLTNSAAFGYRFGKFTPYIGIQYWQYNNSSESDNYLSSLKTESSYSTFNPEIGCKYSVYDVKSFRFSLDVGLSKVFYNAEKKNNGVVDNSDRYSRYNDINTIGLKLGVGAEYFFADYFSVGGNFVIMTYFTDWESGDAVKVKNTSRNINTYSKISLNFYFGN